MYVRVWVGMPRYGYIWGYVTYVQYIYCYYHGYGCSRYIYSTELLEYFLLLLAWLSVYGDIA